MDIIEKQLEFLNETMKETASEANSFLSKYHFGGLIAVLALLNIDLVLTQNMSLNNATDYLLFVVAITLVIYLSFKYFHYVLSHYEIFRESHRKLKYKYELTLHLSLTNGKHRDYQYYLEQSLEDPTKDNFSDEITKINNNEYEFNHIAEYLLNHHRTKYHAISSKKSNYIDMAMAIILLTVGIRGIFLMLSS